MYETAAGGKFNRFLEFSVCLCFSSVNRNNIKIHEICYYKRQGKQRFLSYYIIGWRLNIADINHTCKICLHYFYTFLCKSRHGIKEAVNERLLSCNLRLLLNLIVDQTHSLVYIHHEIARVRLGESHISRGRKGPTLPIQLHCHEYSVTLSSYIMNIRCFKSTTNVY